MKILIPHFFTIFLLLLCITVTGQQGKLKSAMRTSANSARCIITRSSTYPIRIVVLAQCNKEPYGVISSGWSTESTVSVGFDKIGTISFQIEEDLPEFNSDIVTCAIEYNGKIVQQYGLYFSENINTNTVSAPVYPLGNKIGFSFGQWYNSIFRFADEKPINIDQSIDCDIDGMFNYQTDSLTLSIENGLDYVSFYRNGQYAGKTVICSFPFGLNGVTLKQDSINGSGNSIAGSLKVTWGDVKKTYDSAFTIGTVDLNNPIVFTSCDSILYSGDTSLIEGHLSDWSRIARTNGFYAKIISGSEYGQIYDDCGDTLSDRIDYISCPLPSNDIFSFNFVANGNKPIVKVNVVIEVGIIGFSEYVGRLTIAVKPSPIVVSIQPGCVSPGDTALIVIQKRNDDGSLSNFPPGQLFEVGIMEGCEFGKILWHDENLMKDSLASYVASSILPLQFVATANSSLDSGKVIIKIGILDYSQFYKKNIKVIQSKSSKQKYQRKINETCSGRTINLKFTEEIYENIGQNIDLIYPTKDSDQELITTEPKMPKVICRAKLNSYNGGTVTFYWEYTVQYSYLRKERMGNCWQRAGQALCPRHASITFTGVSYSVDENETNWQVPFLIDNIEKVQIIALKPERIPIGKVDKYQGNCSQVINFWDYKSRDIFTGGHVMVEIHAKDVQGNSVGHYKGTVNNIIGLNPDINDIISYINDPAIYAVVRHEGGSRQFTSSTNSFPYSAKGYPLYGPPNGYGLLQIDNGPTPKEMVLWNWQANLQVGIDRYNQSYTSAIKYTQRHPYTNDILRMNTWQNYNAGGDNFYYVWDEDNGKWIISKCGEKNSYAQQVYKLYNP